MDNEASDSFEILLQPHASRFLETDGSGGSSNQLSVGSAIIKSDQPIGVTGIFTLLDADGNFRTESGVAPALATRVATVPVLSDSKTLIGVAVQNVVPGDNNVALTLLTEGKAVKTASKEESAGQNPEWKLVANGHSASFIHQQFNTVRAGDAIVGTEALRSDHSIAVSTWSMWQTREGPIAS